ncbi:alpha/beta hydrolase [Actinoallomurus spadix]|uniref:Alpha/beta hydrolase n=1 Tax=Actinoallomurus spadix TaxID=79912 RepID=A0ABN0WC00_9ACTN|nr:alpha/beta hydrolase [Actinoallomurus spadix]MCO5990410.1 alpha/beta hydrolase [Actinoallomurus spadix]
MRVRVNDVVLYFDVDGCQLVPDGATMVERPTIVLLHGGPGADHSVFKPAFRAAAEFAQVLYLDQRGSGRSDRAGPGSWTWERWADDVVDFCDTLGIVDPILVGTSSGGWVALTAALRHPDRVSKLVLDSVMPGSAQERPAAFERLGGVEAPEAPEMAGRFDPWARLDRLACPTLILACADDPVATEPAARRLAEAITAAPVRLHVLPGTGHGVFREAPGEAFGLLRDFVTEPGS